MKFDNCKIPPLRENKTFYACWNVDCGNKIDGLAACHNCILFNSNEETYRKWQKFLKEGKKMDLL